jgi:amidase
MHENKGSTNSAGDWQQRGSTKRKALLDSIPSEWNIPASIFPPPSQLDVSGFPENSGFFTEEELQYTGSSAETIAQHIVNKEWTSEAVTKAFCKRAAVAHQLVGCIASPSYLLSTDANRRNV